MFAGIPAWSRERSGFGEIQMIELRNLSKSFPTGDGLVDALKHVSLTINDGDI